MLVYAVNLCIVYIFSQLSIVYANQNKKMQVEEKKLNPFFLFVPILSMTLVAGLRLNTGTDFVPYRDMFVYNSGRSLMEVVLGKEGFFYGIGRLISAFTEDTVYIFLFFALLTFTLIAKTIYEYSPQLELSMFLYIASMDFYSSFNWMRQWMAVAILFYAGKYIYQGEKWKYFLAVLIAAHFHNSALLMILVYFIVRSKPWEKVTGIVVGVSVVATLFFSRFMNVLIGYLEGTSYQQYLIDGAADDGVHPLRVLVAFVPVLISFLFYRQINTDEKKEVDIWINFSMLNFLVLILSTQITVLARIGVYFSLYNTLLIPTFLKVLDTKYRLLTYLGTMIVFTIYMIFLLPVDADLLPYQNVLGQLFK